MKVKIQPETDPKHLQSTRPKPAPQQKQTKKSLTHLKPEPQRKKLAPLRPDPNHELSWMQVKSGNTTRTLDGTQIRL